MITRPGAVVVIPLLALYILYFFSGRARAVLRRGALLAIVLVATMMLNGAVFRTVGAEGGIVQGNVYYVLYGIAAGLSRKRSIKAGEACRAACREAGNEAEDDQDLRLKRRWRNPACSSMESWGHISWQQ